MKTMSERKTEASTEVKTYGKMMPTFQSAATKQFQIPGGRIKVEEFGGY
jgi:hypothetical protein